ncbi:MAG: cupin domain-containing protein [Bacteroidales bacterium]|nr:cupin domain-containing protein [Bacteroidales bacterium]
MEKNEFEKSVVFSFKDKVDYSPGGIVSKQVVKTEKGNVSLFAFDKGEALSEHTAPFDAMVQVIDGEVRITIDGVDFNVSSGNTIIMPANIAHAVYATEKFKMILTMLR